MRLNRASPAPGTVRTALASENQSGRPEFARGGTGRGRGRPRNRLGARWATAPEAGQSGLGGTSRHALGAYSRRQCILPGPRRLENRRPIERGRLRSLAHSELADRHPARQQCERDPRRHGPFCRWQQPVELPGPARSRTWAFGGLRPQVHAGIAFGSTRRSAVAKHRHVSASRPRWPRRLSSSAARPPFVRDDQRTPLNVLDRGFGPREHRSRRRLLTTQVLNLSIKVARCLAPTNFTCRRNT